MISANNKAQAVLLSVLGSPLPSLHKELVDVISQGLDDHENMILLSYAKNLFDPALKDQLFDETGVECFINHIHIDDYYKGLDDGESLLICLELARQIMDFDQAKKVKLKIIISLSGEGESSIRFHRLREAQEWLSDDLESYEEAILTLTSV